MSRLEPKRNYMDLLNSRQGTPTAILPPLSILVHLTFHRESVVFIGCFVQQAC